MNTNGKISSKTLMALIVTIFLWSSAFVAIRVGLKDYSPGGLALFRFLVASICMVIFCLFLPDRQSVSFKDKCWLLLLGATTVGGYHLAINYGELTVNAGIASFIISQTPVFTTLLAIIFLKESLSMFAFLGMVISFIGVFLILMSHAAEFHFALGAFYILISTVLGSVFSVTQKSFLNKYHAIDVSAYLIWGASIALFIFIAPLPHEIARSSIHGTCAAIYLGVFPAAVAYLGWSYVLARMPASRAVNFLYVMPLLTTFLGWVLLSEIPSWLSLLGGLIALVGVWVINHSYLKVVEPVMIEEQALTEK